jgi:hypothetical protein
VFLLAAGWILESNGHFDRTTPTRPGVLVVCTRTMPARSDPVTFCVCSSANPHNRAKEKQKTLACDLVL